MDPATLFIWLTMMLITLSMGLGLTVADFRRVLTERRAVWVGTAGQLVLLPLTGWLLALAFGLSGPTAIGLVLIAACPGGTHSNLFAGLARADVALSISLTAVSGLASILTIPLWMWLATRTFATQGQVVGLDLLSTFASLLVVVALPTVVGVSLRERAPAFASRLRTLVTVLGVSLLLLLVVGAVSANGDLVATHARHVGLPVLALNVLTMALGYGMSRTARLPEAQRVTIALEVGIQNSALGYGLAMGMLGGLDYAVPGIVYSLLVYLTGGMFTAWARRRLA